MNVEKQKEILKKHILDSFDNKEDFIGTFNNCMNTKLPVFNKKSDAAKRMVEGGCFLVYEDDIKDFLLNDLGYEKEDLNKYFNNKNDTDISYWGAYIKIMKPNIISLYDEISKEKEDINKGEERE